jgi:hypothetical protein
MAASSRFQKGLDCPIRKMTLLNWFLWSTTARFALKSTMEMQGKVWWLLMSFWMDWNRRQTKHKSIKLWKYIQSRWLNSLQSATMSNATLICTQNNKKTILKNNFYHWNSNLTLFHPFSQITSMFSIRTWEMHIWILLLWWMRIGNL